MFLRISKILVIVEFGSSYSCGCSNDLPVFLISHPAKELNTKNCSPGFIDMTK